MPPSKFPADFMGQTPPSQYGATVQIIVSSAPMYLCIWKEWRERGRMHVKDGSEEDMHFTGFARA